MNTLDMKFSNRHEFIKFLGSTPIKRGVEVGVRDGGFSAVILTYTNLERLYSVDPWEKNSELNDPDTAYKSTLNNLGRFGERSRLIKGYSPDVCELFADNVFDFIYIDGLHTYEAVRDDIAGWYPKIKDGGVIAGHDYSAKDWPGVVRAVDEFVTTNDLKLGVTGIDSQNYWTDELQSSWFFIKEVK